MKNALIPLLILLAPGAGAQGVQVLDADRNVYAQAFGYDYDFNNGIADADDDDGLSGEWIAQALADLDDYYGVPVARGACYQESQVGSTALYFTVDVSADAYGNLFQSDSLARGAYDVTFAAATRQRFALRAHADTSYGYNTASVRLTGAAGTVAQVDGSYGGWDSIEVFGWIDAGTYALEGAAEAQSFAPAGSPDSQHGNAECELLFFHAADYDMDGDVDNQDKSKFKTDYLAGSPDADFDGDGDTDTQDWNKFRQAWNSAQ